MFEKSVLSKIYFEQARAHACTLRHSDTQNAESLLAVQLGFVLIYGSVWEDTSVARLRERDRLRSGMNQLGLP